MGKNLKSGHDIVQNVFMYRQYNNYNILKKKKNKLGDQVKGVYFSYMLFFNKITSTSRPGKPLYQLNH